jgi:protein-tyrosine phosphatase
MQTLQSVLSTKIQLTKLYNTRDLGGMVTSSGLSIRPRCLIRSGELARLSEADKELLCQKYSLHTVIDLRTTTERNETPDPVLPGVENIHIPILSEAAMGITREQESLTLENMLAFMDQNGEGSLGYMAGIYGHMVSDPHCLSQFSQTLRIIMENASGSVLWHCSAGKDRCGMTSAFVQMALGVSREDAIADYLATQTYVQRHVDNVEHAVLAQTGNQHIASEAALLCGVDLRFIQTALDVIDRIYGNFDSFLVDGLQLPQALILSFREHCLA